MNTIEINFTNELGKVYEQRVVYHVTNKQLKPDCLIVDQTIIDILASIHIHSGIFYCVESVYPEISVNEVYIYSTDKKHWRYF